jgi:hypothetical protein
MSIGRLSNLPGLEGLTDLNNLLRNIVGMMTDDVEDKKPQAVKSTKKRKVPTATTSSPKKIPVRASKNTALKKIKEQQDSDYDSVIEDNSDSLTPVQFALQLEKKPTPSSPRKHASESSSPRKQKTTPIVASESQKDRTPLPKPTEPIDGLPPNDSENEEKDTEPIDGLPPNDTENEEEDTRNETKPDVQNPDGTPKAKRQKVENIETVDVMNVPFKSNTVINVDDSDSADKSVQNPQPVKIKPEPRDKIRRINESKVKESEDDDNHEEDNDEEIIDEQQYDPADGEDDDSDGDNDTPPPCG